MKIVEERHHSSQSGNTGSMSRSLGGSMRQRLPSIHQSAIDSMMKGVHNQEMIQMMSKPFGEIFVDYFAMASPRDSIVTKGSAEKIHSNSVGGENQ